MKWTHNKFGARRTTCMSGHNHDSALEAGYCDYLYFEVADTNGGDVVAYTAQCKAINLTHGIKWRLDFLVVYRDGTQAFVDVKGKETEAFKLKKRIYVDMFRKGELPFPLLIIKGTKTRRGYVWDVTNVCEPVEAQA